MRLLARAMSVFPRRTLRVQLALLYTGIVFASGLVLIAIPNLFLGTAVSLVHQSASHVQYGSAPGPALANSQHGADVHQAAIGSAIALLVLVALSLVLGWLLAGRFLRPLRTITATARDISASNLNRRLALGGPRDEFKELGGTLDDLFGRLQASFESQRHFVANASHELRTPLTAERTLIQVALADPDADAETLRATCEELLKLGDHQERLIDSLLTLATSERGIDAREPVDLAQVASKVLLGRSAEAERRGIDTVTALGFAPAAGDASLVESLVANLVDNAIQHNVSGGRVEVSTAATAGGATIWVRNTGPVIPAGEVDRLFQPFQQLAGERLRHSGGHGLGLAIVRAIAGAHGATLTARPRAGGGLEVEVTFLR